MGYCQRLSVTIVTAADGSGTGYIVVPNGGRVLAILYSKAGAAAYSDGVGVVVTVDNTGQPITTFASGGAAMDVSKTTYPRAQVHSVAAGGTGLTLEGSQVAHDAIPVADGDRLKFVVAAGGNTKTGTFHALIG